MPKVSVIIPTYNGEDYICDAIDSVFSQTYKDCEVIVVDDGSADGTKEALKRYNGKIIYLYQNNGGTSAARNKGIKEASGKYMAFLDADDIWFPEKLSLQVSELEKNKDLGLVGAFMETIDSEGKPLGRIKPKNVPGSDFESALISGSPAPSSFLIRKECFDQVGYFDETISIFEDLDLFIRISRRYSIKTLVKRLGGYRIHSSNITKDEIRVYYSQIILAKKWLRYSLPGEAKKVLLERVKKYAMLLAKHNLKKYNIIVFLKFYLVSITYMCRILINE